MGLKQMLTVGCVTLFFSSVVLWYATHKENDVWCSQAPGTPVLILDAGHGGEDGGAVSLSGYKESDINLSIVRKLDSIISLYQRPPVLTRWEDVSLHDEAAQTLRDKKASDLKNRAVLIEAVPHATLLSIHQNSFQSPSVSGFQAFYRAEEESQQLAELIQEAMKETLEPHNKKKAKEIPEHVYLMHHISCSAVLLECGFLTNPEDERKLLDPDYQKRLAAVVSSVWLQSIQKENM